MRQKVEEELPLKQGLKLSKSTKTLSNNTVEEELPLKQGLKPICRIYLLNCERLLKRNFH